MAFFSARRPPKQIAARKLRSKPLAICATRWCRDVRTAWLAANTAFQRVGVEAELAKEMDTGTDSTRGTVTIWASAPIVELSQAQLQQTKRRDWLRHC